MDTFVRRDLQQLLEVNAGPCVSVYLPTSPIGVEGQAGPVHLKNLLTEAEEMLVARGMRAPAARDFVKPGVDLLTDNLFWKQQSRGLALFLTADSLRTWRLPEEFAEWVSIGDRFQIKQLLPLVVGDDRYFLLAVSQNHVALFAGDRNGLTELPNHELPSGMIEALNYQKPETLRSFRSQGRNIGGSAQSAAYHGQGGLADEEKDELLEYFRVIDRALHSFLHGRSEPLLFAGVEYLFPIYRRANTYPHLLDDSVVGNSTHWNKTELQARAEAVMDPRRRETQTKDRLQVREAVGTGLASTYIDQVLSAAQDGVVDVLFAASDEPVWGRFDPTTRRTDVHSQRESEDVDLLDLAAFLTLTHGGRAYAVPAREIPAGSIVAAHFRYGAPALAAQASGNA